MSRFPFHIAAMFLTLCSVVSIAQEPRRLTRPVESPSIWGVLEAPAAPGAHPGVILLPGSAGWRPAYAQVAKAFADSGFVALALDYYGETGLDSSREDRLAMWPRWQIAVRNAAAYLQALPSVSGHPVGLVGYSRGAFLAVSVGTSAPGVRAVVEFFGGGGGDADSLDRQVRRLPPLLILHGEADTVVPLARAYELREAVLARGGEVEMHLYPGAHHAFNAPFSPAYSGPEAVDSWKRTIEFLRRRLVPPRQPR